MSAREWGECLWTARDIAPPEPEPLPVPAWAGEPPELFAPAQHDHWLDRPPRPFDWGDAFDEPRRVRAAASYAAASAAWMLLEATAVVAALAAATTALAL